MQTGALIDHLESDGQLLVAAARRAGWDARVPGCDWSVRELVTHTGGIHRWAADIVATCGQRFDTEAGKAVGTGPADDELAEWFLDGHAALVATLRAAAPDLECATFLPADSPRHFWCRRQAHETAIHRVDAEGAAGAEITPFEVEFAQDGIGEILLGFAARRREAPAPGVIGLDVLDDGASWVIRLGGDRIEAEQSDDLGSADFTVRGDSSDVYRWLWNRPAAVEYEGEKSLGQWWRDSVHVRWN